MSTGITQSDCIGPELRDVNEVGDTRPGTLFTLWIEEVELQRLLAAYDPSSGTSPGVADARPVLRAILNSAIAGAPTA